MASFEDLPDETRAQLAKTMYALLGDTETARDTKRLIKKKNPNYRDAELEVDARVTEALEPVQKKLKEIEEERSKERFQSEREKARRSIEARGLDFEAVEKFAQEKEIASYETAANYMQMEAQMATPTSPSLAFQKPTEDIAKLYNNPTKLRETRQAKAHEAITEIMRNRRAI